FWQPLKAVDQAVRVNQAYVAQIPSLPTAPGACTWFLRGRDDDSLRASRSESVAQRRVTSGSLLLLSIPWGHILGCLVAITDRRFGKSARSCHDREEYRPVRRSAPPADLQPPVPYAWM